MEIPDSNRVTITGQSNGLEIQIRPGRHWLDIAAAIFPALLLVFFGYNAVKGSFDGFAAIIGWGIFGFALLFLAIKRACWLITGKEIVTVSNGMLLIQRKGLLWLFNTDECPLSRVKDFTVRREAAYSGTKYRMRIMGRRGTIRFTCDGEPRRFGDMLSEEESNYIIQKLKEKKLIT
jgi:hypothetical protein